MSIRSVRRAAVAGSFYPAHPDELRTMVRDYLDQAQAEGPAPKAMIAPHAGYIYSGPIAATAYKRLAGSRDRITRVVLLGPAHRVGFEGIALSSAQRFATPLGEVPVDGDAIEAIAGLPQVFVLDEAHAREHSLEVHLPFLQEALDHCTLVPLCVGAAGPQEVAEVLDALWDGPETLIVVSSDLSHYHDYATARTLDLATSRAIEALRHEDIQYEHACGRQPMRGLLVAAKRRGMKATAIDVRSSGDTTGPRDAVVGYGAYVFEG